MTENKKLAYIKPHNTIKKVKYTAETKEIVDLIMDGKYYFFKNLDVVEFKNGIDWNYQHHNSSNTYQLYLHSLEAVNHLCSYYEVNKKVDVIKKANEIILDWINNNLRANTSRYSWYNHTVASRSLAIVYFYSLSKGVLAIDEELLYECLVEHATFLANDSKYVKNNHGIMMDRALILLSIVLKANPSAKLWQEKALFRIREAFNRDFSYKGVHLENSPDYHSMVRRLFISTEQFLQKNNLTLGEDIINRLDRTNEYFKYLYKPDKTIPIIGDTSKSTNLKLEKKFQSFIDTEAGIAILQDKNINSPELSTWISFVCGYGSKTHKHHDDLSINLFYKGKDIFIDSGKYNYNKTDVFRKYIISPLAHSTIAVKGESYRIGDPILEQENIKITDYTTNKYYDLVKGKNTAYSNVSFVRTLIFFKPDVLIIFDNVSSDVKNEYLQIFNLAPHIEIKKLDGDNALLKSGDEVIKIEQLIGDIKSKSYHGDRNIPRAVYSEKFGKLIDNHQIEFIKMGKSVNFLTLIKMGNNNNRLGNLSFDNENSILSLEIDKQFLTIPL